MSFSIGQEVNVAGDLYRGPGVVTDIWDENGVAHPSNTGAVAVRRDQSFPQVGIRKPNGKHNHYNGSDIRAGKVTALEPAVAPSAAPVAAPAASVTGNADVSVSEGDGDAAYVSITVPRGVTVNISVNVG